MWLPSSVGTDSQLAEFGQQVERVSSGAKENDIESREMFLKQWVVDKRSSFCGLTLENSGIRNTYRCLVVGVEKEDGVLIKPDAAVVLEAGDIVWVVGERDAVYHLMDN